MGGILRAVARRQHDVFGRRQLGFHVPVPQHFVQDAAIGRRIIDDQHAQSMQATGHDHQIIGFGSVGQFQPHGELEPAALAHLAFDSDSAAQAFAEIERKMIQGQLQPLQPAPALPSPRRKSSGPRPRSRRTTLVAKPVTQMLHLIFPLS
ncbi:MAG: hypothetical protein EA424_18360 [Planctomycetaceae bacterium]|nr:MAG: hypothetical protein EA424_18360 [Planctomycetaceae bacterium]